MKKIKELPIGSNVKDKHNKYNPNFSWKIIAKNHKGYPANSVTLIREDSNTYKCLDAKEPFNPDGGRKGFGNNRYSLSNARQWLNSDKKTWFSKTHSYDAPPTADNVEYPYDEEQGFLCYLSDYFKSNILETSIESAKPNVDGGGIEILKDKVFIPSMTEVNEKHSNGIEEGVPIDYFVNTPVTGKYYTFTRTPQIVSSNYSWYISDTTSLTFPIYGIYGIIPMLNVKDDMFVSDAPDSSGYYNILYPPYLDCVNENLGSYSESFVKYYTIQSFNEVKVSIYLDGENIQSFITTATENKKYSIDLKNYWTDLIPGEHKLKIELTNSVGNVSSTLTFSKEFIEHPTITINDNFLGNKNTGFYLDFFVDSKNSTSVLDVTIKLDNDIINTIKNANKKQNYCIDIVKNFEKLRIGKHIIEILVVDKDVSFKKELFFNKEEDSIFVKRIDKENITLLKNKMDDLNAENIKISDIDGIKSTNIKDAIQEVLTISNNAQKEISSVIGSPLSANDTLITQKSKIQSLKNTMASNLSSKGVNCSGSNTLDNLISSITSIKNASSYIEKGTFNPSQSSGRINVKVTNLNFTPTVVVLLNTNTDDGSSSSKKWGLYYSAFKGIYLYGSGSSINYVSCTPISKGFDLTFETNGNPIRWYAIGAI